MITIGNGNKFINSNICSSDGEIIINGKKIPKPPTKCNNIYVNNGKVSVDGYEYKDGEWKKTIFGMFHKCF